MKLRDVIEKRADVKRYDSKKPDWRKIVRAIDAARFAPMAGNHFSARFILVSDEKVIKRLADASQQSFIRKARTVVVVVSDDKSLIRSYGERGEMYARQHVGAAIENFLLALEEEKLVTSWVWYFVDEQVRRILEIPEGVKIEGIFPVGRRIKAGRLADLKSRVRNVKLENILFFGKYGQEEMKLQTKLRRESV
ncbi:nitroreductase family protein [Candidatus Pacearchaeota archaeon]|nr:nitroreductase family protein [Candidatus Pacearchaeota archaeon]